MNMFILHSNYVNLVTISYLTDAGSQGGDRYPVNH